MCPLRNSVHAARTGASPLLPGRRPPCSAPLARQQARTKADGKGAARAPQRPAGRAGNAPRPPFGRRPAGSRGGGVGAKPGSAGWGGICRVALARGDHGGMAAEPARLRPVQCPDPLSPEPLKPRLPPGLNDPATGLSGTRPGPRPGHCARPDTSRAHFRKSRHSENPPAQIRPIISIIY
ncbi:protein of unknown function [Rhodovastum atsumiense]|nr:protein of unknown function [Rhodovastum atsumiense]